MRTTLKNEEWSAKSIKLNKYKNRDNPQAIMGGKNDRKRNRANTR